MFLVGLIGAEVLLVEAMRGEDPISWSPGARVFPLLSVVETTYSGRSNEQNL